jgi:tRNA A-37 threonylcarbamoyl transferase component Bud32
VTNIDKQVDGQTKQRIRNILDRNSNSTHTISTTSIIPTKSPSPIKPSIPVTLAPTKIQYSTPSHPLSTINTQRQQKQQQSGNNSNASLAEIPSEFFDQIKKKDLEIYSLNKKVHTLSEEKTQMSQEIIRLKKDLELMKILATSIVDNHSKHESNSYKYYHNGFLDFQHKISDEEFYDAGRSSDWLELDDHRKEQLDMLSREVILVNYYKDENLRQYVNTLETLITDRMTEKDCFVEIAKFVHNTMGGNVTPQDCSSVIKLLKQKARSNVVELGKISHGQCRHRAILFKFLCDRLIKNKRLLSCRLVRGEKNGAHAWNVVHIANESKHYVVDVMQCPGTLLDEATEECQKYKRNERHGYGGISIRQQLSSSLTGKDFNVGEMIGYGGFSEVYEATLKSNPSKQYVFKVMKSIDSAVTEVGIMNLINHDNVMKMKCSFKQQNQYIIVMKKMDMSVKDLIEYHSHILKDKEQLLLLLLYCAKGIRCMHRHSIMHRDIKPQNILIKLNESKTEILKVKVSDFGTGKMTQDVLNTHLTKVSTQGYEPPEFQTGTYDFKYDSYQYGLLLAEVVTGQVCTQGNEPPNVKHQRKDFAHEELYDLFKRCTQEESWRRPDFDQIIEQLELCIARFIVQRTC